MDKLNKKFELNWIKLDIIGHNWTKLDEIDCNWTKQNEIGKIKQKWEKLDNTVQNQTGLVKIGQN